MNLLKKLFNKSRGIKNVSKNVVSLFMAAVLMVSNVSPTMAVGNEERKNEENKPKISIAIPVYNVEKYLRECLDSVVNQTLRDIEIICVDDGSSDNSGKILDEYAAKDDRIIAIHQENQGPSVARNVGLDIAKGEYIKFVDSDDYLDLKTCEICYNKAKEVNADILVHGGYTFTEQGKDVWQQFEYKIFNDKQFSILSRNSVMHLYKTKFIKNNGVRYNNMARMGEDQCFNMMAYPKAKNIVSIPDMLYYYRTDNNGSLCHVTNNQKHVDDLCEHIKFICNDWDSSGHFKNDEAKIGFLNWVASLIYWPDDYFLDKKFLRVIDKKILKKEILDLLTEEAKNKLNKVISIVNERSDAIPIAMAMDDNYLYPTMVAITSAMENANKDTKYDFYIMHPGNFTQESKNKILSLQKNYSMCSINLIDMENHFKSAPESGHITTPTYYRLSLPNLLLDIDKMIWLDGDTVVFCDLKEMFDIDINGYYYKGFLDNNVKGAESFGIINDHYICAGVMLMNLKELRSDDMVAKFEKFIEKNKSKLVQHDQTTINVMCYEKIGILPAKFGIFNCFDSKKILEEYVDNLIFSMKYTKQEVYDAYENPYILHCVDKPWNKPNVNGGKQWWSYAKKTDFYDEIKNKYLPHENTNKKPKNQSEGFNKKSRNNKLISNGVYTITSQLDNNKVLDVAGASSENGANIQLYENNGTVAQKFNLEFQNDGSYIMRSLSSGKVLDVQGGEKSQGANVWQYEFNGSDAQKWLVRSVGNGYYNLISKCNGLCLDVSGACTENGTNIHCWLSNDTASQKFKFKTVISNGKYMMSSALNNIKAVDVAGASKENGANVQLYESNNTEAQNFNLEFQNDGSYVIRSSISGKVLDVQGAGQAEGTNVWQYEFNGSDAQKWLIRSVGEGYYTLVSKCNGLCLDVSGACIDNGTNIQCWTNNGTLSQKFRLDRIEENKIVSDSAYMMASELDNNKVVDVAGASKESGANVQLYESNNTEAQKFKLKYVNDGCYVVESVNSGKVLDVQGGERSQGANVWQYEFNGSDAQKWQIRSVGNGYYNLISKCNGLCLDISGACTNNGTNIQCWNYNATASQKFSLVA